jgi:hypothetical protein
MAAQVDAEMRGAVAMSRHSSPVTVEQVMELAREAAANYGDRFYEGDPFEALESAIRRIAGQEGAATKNDPETFVRMLLWDTFPECCGCPVEDYGGEYMGQRETVMSCCGNPEPALLNDTQIVASLRERFPAPPPGESAQELTSPAIKNER